MLRLSQRLKTLHRASPRQVELQLLLPTTLGEVEDKRYVDSSKVIHTRDCHQVELMAPHFGNFQLQKVMVTFD